MSEIDPAAPLLLFDSGVGGLSVLAELRRALPSAPVIYVADNGGLPYGPKTEAEVAARVCGLLGRMAERFRPRLICIACNTASTIALGMVRDVLEIPIVGTVPAIKPAAEQTRSGTIGLLGTAATIRQPYVDRLEAEFAQGKRLLRAAAPDLVSAAEAKLRGEPVNPETFRLAATSLRDQAGGAEMDTVVLACTHFPLLEADLAQAFGPGVRFVHGGAGIARRIVRLAGSQPMQRLQPDLAMFTRSDPGLSALQPALERYGLTRLEVF